MLSTGALIWISCKPLLKMALATFTGFVLTRYDLFGNVAARGTGQIILNITMPALLFSKIVPSFTSDNLSALGPLILIGVIYQFLGLGIAWLVSQFFWVPHRFRYGILVAGCWANWGDLPTAIILSITSAAPFSGKDSDLAVAYVSVFILVFFVSLFPLGGHLLIAKDFKGPDLEDDEVRTSFTANVRAIAAALLQIPTMLHQILRSRKPLQERALAENKLESQVAITEKDIGRSEEVRIENADQKQGGTVGTPTVALSREPTCDTDVKNAGVVLSKRVTFDPEDEKIDFGALGRTDGGQSVFSVPPSSSGTMAVNTVDDPAALKSDTPLSVGGSPTTPKKSKTFKSRTLSFLRSLLSAPTIAIALSFPIALVPELKSLFVLTSTSHKAPDGLPPLAVLLDTTAFLGDASIPLGLICLGSALANLNIPRPFTRLPLGAISSFTIGKMFLMPVLGVLICELFTHQIPIIDKHDKVLRFVCIIFSSLPTATSQVFLTQVYSPDGTAQHLSAFLLPQYAIMFLSVTTLTAYTLHLLFG